MAQIYSFELILGINLIVRCHYAFKSYEKHFKLEKKNKNPTLLNQNAIWNFFFSSLEESIEVGLEPEK